MTNVAPGAFGYLWLQQKGTKGTVGVLVVEHFLGFRGEKRILSGWGPWFCRRQRGLMDD